MIPKDCVNSECKNIYYTPNYLAHLSLFCEKCVDNNK